MVVVRAGREGGEKGRENQARTFEKLVSQNTMRARLSNYICLKIDEMPWSRDFGAYSLSINVYL